MDPKRAPYKLCTTCEISKNFPVNQIPKSFDYKKCSNQSKNDILLKIYESKEKLTPAEKFIIFVDKSRYGIETISKTEKEIRLKQFFLHYDSVKKNLVPVYVRFVIITI